jgi:archaemetzincin
MTARVLTATMTQPRRASVDQGRTVYSVLRILLGVAAALTCRLLAEAAPMNPEPTSAQLKTAAGKIASLHKKKTLPGADDWLANHHEAGQTSSQYRRSNPNRPTSKRTTIYVQPIGEFSAAQKKVVGETAELLSRFYGVPTKVLDALDLDVIPAKARRVDGGEHQILTTYVLDKVLKPKRPADAVAVLGLTTSDLWPGKGWNYVFGQASLSDRVGVWSIARYGNLEGSQSDHRLACKRTFKVALHETGHMLGITHCTAYECLLNGSNSLAEMDSRPLWLCPECVQKVWWACHADPVKRYEALIEFGKQHDLDAEVEFWQKSADRLSGEPHSAPGR